ncbi:MAG: hypothetical protein AAFY73_04485 [Pseudomonadota bacterium]
MAEQSVHISTQQRLAPEARVRREGEMAATFMYKLVGAFTLLAFVLIVSGSLLGYKAVDLPTGPADFVRDVRVENDGVGTVALVDASTGGLLGEFPAEQRHPIRDAFRRFDLMRVAASKPPLDTYTILSWNRGDMAITAPDVGFQINIPAGKPAEALSILISETTAKVGG